MLSYDLHVHPGPSKTLRWGDGQAVWDAARAAGVRGFVWKAHERHTVDDVRELADDPVWAIPSASLNPWSTVDDVMAALQAGAFWLWGPTQTFHGEIGWELPLPKYWQALRHLLADYPAPLVLATGHVGEEGRLALAGVASENPMLMCSITHSLFVPRVEVLELADRGCLFEMDAYTYAIALGRPRADIAAHLDALLGVGALVYFTSDGGQQSTGNPFDFGAETLDRIAAEIGPDRAKTIGVTNPSLVIERLRAPSSA
jgi:Family of unknown function (DUF6282)